MALTELVLQNRLVWPRNPGGVLRRMRLATPLNCVLPLLWAGTGHSKSTTVAIANENKGWAFALAMGKETEGMTEQRSAWG